MTKNVTALDAKIRTFVAIGLLTVAALNNTRPLVAIGSAGLALFVLVTALERYCPLYTILGIKTPSR